MFLAIKWRLLKAPSLISSGLYISVFQDKLNRGGYNIFEKDKNCFHISDKPWVYISQAYFSNLFYAPNMIKLRFFNLNGYCHQRSKNYILIPRFVGPRKKEGVPLASADYMTEALIFFFFFLWASQ